VSRYGGGYPGAPISKTPADSIVWPAALFYADERPRCTSSKKCWSSPLGETYPRASLDRRVFGQEESRVIELRQTGCEGFEVSGGQVRSTSGQLSDLRLEGGCGLSILKVDNRLSKVLGL
jgi:hypothetical protein